MSPRLRPRAAALLAAGAFGLHQLRYLTGYGDGASGALASHGHGYMALAAPLVGVALMLVLADFLERLRARRAPAATASLRQLWAGAAACLFTTYVVQETAEGVLAAGHPAGVAGVLGHGGWVALPLAAALGLVVALLARGGRRALELAAEPPVRLAAPRAVLALCAVAPRPRPGAFRRARRLRARGPPLPSSA